MPHRSHRFVRSLHTSAITAASAIFALNAPILAQTQPEAISWKAQHCRLLARASEPPGPKVIVSDIVLNGPTDVAGPVWNQIVSKTKSQIFSGSGWVEELQQVNLLGGLQNQGYLNAQVTADATVLSSSPALEYALVHARVRGGTQYELSGVQFRGVDSKTPLAYSTEQLRPLVPLDDGNIFSTEKLRMGLDALRRYYESRGYVDFVAIPDLQIDDMQQEIALVVKLQEGLQFRVGKIEVLGLDSTLENDLRSRIRSGDILNLQLISDFYRDHRSQLPEEVLPEDTEFHADTRDRIADVQFDFRNCAQLLQN